MISLAFIQPLLIKCFSSLECSSMWVDCIIELCNVDHEYDDGAKFDSTVMTVCIIAVWKGNVYVRYRTSFG